MSRDFREVDRETAWLLPPSVQDWLPEDHLARFVVEIVDSLDLGRLTSALGHGGKRAYHPGMLLALLFYGYATGVFSSRKLEQATWDSVAFRYVAANSHPDHDTIAAFRKRFVGELGDLFVQILMMARSMGFLKLGAVSLDGTKVQANASRHKALSWEYANRLETQLQAEVEQLMAMAEAADAEAAGEVDVPAELKRREDRLAAIRAAKAEMEARAAARHAEEEKIWREKMAARAAREEQTGRRSGGKPPSRPLSLLKTSSAPEILAFQPTADYRLLHENDRHDPRRLRPRDRLEPRDVTAGKRRSPPTSGGPEAGKTTAAASSPRPRVLGLAISPVATLEGRPCHRQARDGHRLAPPGVPPFLEMEVVPRKAGSPANLEGNT